MTERASIFCSDTRGVTVNEIGTVVTVHGTARDTLYLHGTRTERLELLRGWARAEGMFLVTEINSASEVNRSGRTGWIG